MSKYDPTTYDPIKAAQRYQENKISRRATQKIWYEKNKEKVIARKKELPSQSPAAQRERGLLRLYELSIAQYTALSIQQGDRCAICRGFPKGNKPLCVDHCHTTHKIRGLLCDSCNRGMGLLKDSSTVLLRALEYFHGK